MKKNILFFVFILLCLLFAFFIIHPSNGNSKLIMPFDKHAEEWNGLQNLSHENDFTETIDIPGFESLVLIKSQDSQKVNFYNPKTNTCLLKLSLLINNKTLWQSEFIEPDKGFYNIHVNLDSFEAGDYLGLLQVECFKTDGTQLNGANIEIKITIKE